MLEQPFDYHNEFLSFAVASNQAVLSRLYLVSCGVIKKFKNEVLRNTR